MSLEFPESSSTSTFFFFLNIIFYSRASNSWWATAVQWELLQTERERRAIPGRKSALSQQLSSWKGLIFVLKQFASSPKAVLFFSFFLSCARSFCTELPHTCVSAKKPFPLANGSHPIRHRQHPTLTSCSIFNVVFGVCLTQAALAGTYYGSCNEAWFILIPFYAYLMC